VKSAGCGVFLNRRYPLSEWRTMESTEIETAGRNQTGQEPYMNVRTITTVILAVALMASAAGVCAAEQSGQGYPYTGPNTPVMTSA
jgi:hypothetical protein